MKIMLITYDIVEDKTRTKVADTLLNYGLQRMQYSVFLGRLKPHLYKAIKAKILKLIDEKHDKVYIFTIPKYAIENCAMWGIKTDLQNIIEPPETLII